MKKHPVITILILGAVLLSAGVCAAYYNTKTLAVDEDAVLFSKDSDGITVLDYKIYYKDLKNVYDKTNKYLPKEACSTAPHIVVESHFASYIMYK
ncbi:MAG: hypothetical protein LIO43_06360 [Clostridiales bacterium]|nr:hypothetical protein [Clostridiales bacterium]